jgi:hypothetical protein
MSKDQALRSMLPLVVLQPNSGLGCLTAEVSTSHTMTHSDPAAVPWASDQPVTESATCYNTQYSQDTKIHAPGGIQTCNPSKQATTGISLKPCSHCFSTKSITNSKYLYKNYTLASLKVNLNFIRKISLK